MKLRICFVCSFCDLVFCTITFSKLICCRPHRAGAPPAIALTIAPAMLLLRSPPNWQRAHGFIQYPGRLLISNRTHLFFESGLAGGHAVAGTAAQLRWVGRRLLRSLANSPVGGHIQLSMRSLSSNCLCYCCLFVVCSFWSFVCSVIIDSSIHSCIDSISIHPSIDSVLFPSLDSISAPGLCPQECRPAVCEVPAAAA